MSQEYEDHVGSIIKIARKAYGRAVSANLPVEFEDIKEEVSLAWVVANNGFDEEKGFKFSTYFYNVAFTRLNKFFEKLGKQTIELGLQSTTILTEEGESQLEDLVESDVMSPQDMLLESDNFGEFYSNLKSDDAKLAIDMLINPPEFIEQELIAHIAKTNKKQSEGIAARCPRDMNLKFILRFIAKLRNEKNAYANSLHDEIRQSARLCLVS